MKFVVAIAFVLFVSGTYASVEECRLTYYTSDPSENDGYTVTADGTDLDHSKNIVAVSQDRYKSMKHKTIRIEGEDFTVRDICSSCTEDYLAIDVLVASEEIANERGAYFTECEVVDD
jgi:hypothetical protein